jgi:hypothetical protein
MTTPHREPEDRSPSSQDEPVPFPGTEWGDEDDFKAYWGQTLDEVVEQSRREDEGRPRRVFETLEELFAALEAGANGRADL